MIISYILSPINFGSECGAFCNSDDTSSIIPRPLHMSCTPCLEYCSTHSWKFSTHRPRKEVQDGVATTPTGDVQQLVQFQVWHVCSLVVDDIPRTWMFRTSVLRACRLFWVHHLRIVKLGINRAEILAGLRVTRECSDFHVSVPQ